MTLKRLSFVRRTPSADAGDFAGRWAALALQVPPAARPAGLVHCVVRPGRADRPYHGVAMQWFPDRAAADAYDRAVDASALAAVLDVAATVHVQVRDRAVFGQRQLDEWRATSDGTSRMVLLGVIHRQPTLTREQFADYWWNEHRPLADRLLPAEVWPPIYLHNYVVPGEPWPWDGVGEFYDDSLDVAKARTQWAERAAASAIVEDEERFLVRDTRWSLVTDATVLIATP